MPLYERYKNEMHYQFTQWLSGYELYSLKAYPYAVKSSNPDARIKVEIFRIDHIETITQIHQIEIDAGYDYEDVLLDGKAMRIYLFPKVANDMKVVSGDWVQFFGT